MDARDVWKSFAMSEEGRALAAQLDDAEDDQLDKLGKLDHTISRALTILSAKMDKTLVPVKKCEAETVYRSRFYGDHVELHIKLPTDMVLELAEMLTHYEDHNCVDAANGLDAFNKTVVTIMMESLSPDVVAAFLEEEEEEEEGE